VYASRVPWRAAREIRAPVAVFPVRGLGLRPFSRRPRRLTFRSCLWNPVSANMQGRGDPADLLRRSRPGVR
jgi:hypothetical protein